MDTRDRHAALDYGHLALHIAGVLLVIAVWVFVIWQIVAPVKTLVYDQDGTVCWSRASALTCLPTRAKP